MCQTETVVSVLGEQRCRQRGKVSRCVSEDRLKIFSFSGDFFTFCRLHGVPHSIKQQFAGGRIGNSTQRGPVSSGRSTERFVLITNDSKPGEKKSRRLVIRSRFDRKSF